MWTGAKGSHDAAQSVSFLAPQIGPALDTADPAKLFCALLRDIFGNPFRAVIIDPQWQSSTVTTFAQAIYDDRAFDRLPILADALEDAGCTDASILEHCRGGGVHARGCWVVDLLLGKE